MFYKVTIAQLVQRGGFGWTRVDRDSLPEEDTFSSVQAYSDGWLLGANGLGHGACHSRPAGVKVKN
jgi:hypothetical protein